MKNLDPSNAPGPPRSSGELSVTANLHEALTRLRHPYVDRILWVDAICINQDGMDERNHQVLLMAQIYATASRVLVWLGEDNGDGGERALDELLALAKGTTDTGNGTIATIDLSQRPWFRRVWVLQEVAAARHILVMCGSRVIAGQAFYLGVTALRKRFGEHSKGLATLNSMAQLMKDAFVRTRQNTDGVVVKARFSLNISRLGDLLAMFCTHEATDARDKIFALLGMACDDLEGSGLEPDYSLPFDVLIGRLCSYLFGSGLSLLGVNALDKPVLYLKGKARVLGEVRTPTNPGSSVDIELYQQGRSPVCRYPPQRRGFRGGANPVSAGSIHSSDVLVAIYGPKHTTYLFVRMLGDYAVVISTVNQPHGENQYLDQDHDHGGDHELLFAWCWGGSPEHSHMLESSLESHQQSSPENYQERALRRREAALVHWGLGHFREGESLIEKAHGELRQMSEHTGDGKIGMLSSLIPNSWEKTWTELLRLRRLEALVYKMTGEREGYFSERRLYELITLDPYDKTLLPCLDELLTTSEEDTVQITSSMMKRALMDDDLGILLREAILTTRGTRLEPSAVVRLAQGSEVAMQAFVQAKKVQGDDWAVIQALVKALSLADWITYESLWPAEHFFSHITPDILKAAAKNRLQGPEIVEHLLREYWDEEWNDSTNPLTESVFEEAPQNHADGGWILRILYESRKRHGLPVKKHLQAAMRAALEDRDAGDSVLGLLKIDQKERVGLVTQETIHQMVSLRKRAEKVFEVLLEQGYEELVMTEEVVEMALSQNHKRGARWVEGTGPLLVLLLRWEGKQLPIDASKLGTWLAEDKFVSTKLWALEILGQFRGLDVLKDIADAAERKRHRAGEELFSEMIHHMRLPEYVRELGREELRALDLEEIKLPGHKRGR